MKTSPSRGATLPAINFIPYDVEVRCKCADEAAAAGVAPSQEPREGMQWTLSRAADFLEHYAAYIHREVKAADIEAHPYLPELEYVAGQVRTAAGVAIPQTPKENDRG